VDPRDPTGVSVLVEREFSDTLLLAMLRARRPELYRAPKDLPAPTVENHLQVNIQVPEVRRALRDLVEATAAQDAALEARES
jgi:hypothetical protein